MAFFFDHFTIFNKNAHKVLWKYVVCTTTLTVITISRKLLVGYILKISINNNAHISIHLKSPILSVRATRRTSPLSDIHVNLNQIFRPGSRLWLCNICTKVEHIEDLACDMAWHSDLSSCLDYRAHIPYISTCLQYDYRMLIGANCWVPILNTNFSRLPIKARHCEERKYFFQF